MRGWKSYVIIGTQNFIEGFGFVKPRCLTFIQTVPASHHSDVGWLMLIVGLDRMLAQMICDFCNVHVRQSTMNEPSAKWFAQLQASKRPFDL